MKTLFLWVDVDYVSRNYHGGGSLMVVADSLDSARELVRTAISAANSDNAAYDRYRTGGFVGERVPYPSHNTLPDDCSALTQPPTLGFKISGEAEDRIVIFPNAGCC